MSTARCEGLTGSAMGGTPGARPPLGGEGGYSPPRNPSGFSSSLRSHSPLSPQRNPSGFLNSCRPDSRTPLRGDIPTVHCTESCHVHSRSGNRPKRNAPEANERESQLLGKTVPHSGQKNQSESRLIPLNSSATALRSFTPNAVWTVTSSRSRATSHI
ncbi:MAG: hypothetical protein PWR21_1558 [Methanoculleus sp.]|nr:hypothetical protein [Methanoculleus sp.]MDK2989964.1 hypothetical protein [Methanoculleus sp.]